MQYDFLDIELRWQHHWAQQGVFRTPNPGDRSFDPAKPKFYVLDMFPYPSGVGLHVGHPLGYIATDIVARYRRMAGYNVLHPMGYDAFGLPAEQFAVEHGQHPRITTEQNIANMTRQLKRLGLSYDWDRRLATTDADYYRWTQWIFLQLFHSWFDPVQHKARPITELVQLLESEQVYIDPYGELVPAGASEGLDMISGTPIGLLKWGEISQEERERLLDSFRLAYQAEAAVNWCPALGTVLANEEVTNDGRSERGNYPVFRRPLKQWMLRITAYADRLHSELELVDWPESIKQMQRNWIGQSLGAMVDFPLLDGPDHAQDETVRVFTTRPDTLFGATYMVLAPEHPLVETITSAAQYPTVNLYRNEAGRKTELERQAEAASGAKTGVFTGAYARNPVNGQAIPIWIADYVLMGYGTGAIMAVPAHDPRDFEFARQFQLPIIAVVMPDDAWLRAHGPADSADLPIEQLRNRYLHEPAAFDQAFVGHGAAVHSANDQVSLNGLPTEEAKATITRWLSSQGLGKAKVQYKLRDWLFARQRYWGEPFPIAYGPDGRAQALPEDALPVTLPDLDDFRPAASDDRNALPQPPLARAADSWKHLTIDGVQYVREFNTMPQWAGSCWYYLRFIDPHNQQRFVGKEAERYWMAPRADAPAPVARHGGVDLYVGGAEHAVLHLLYARFWHKVLFDLGHVSSVEPFGKLFNQGYIQAYAYTDARGVYVPAAEVEERDGRFYYQDQEVKQEFGKMGKSLKNAITPDEICEQYGCDTLRLYEMYLGPLDQSKIWRTRDITGVHRFLQRLWRNFVDENGELKVVDQAPPLPLRRLLHKTIKRVVDALESMSFNVGIAALIELNNELVARDKIEREIAEAMVLCLSPLAPHIAEELWARLGHKQTLAYESFPRYEPQMLVEDQIEYPVQVNGKLRGKVVVATDANDKTVEEAARNDEKVKPHLEGKTLRKVIIIKGKLVNLVVS